MRISFQEPYTGTVTRDQLSQGLEQCVQNKVHAQVLGQSKCRPTKCFRLRPGVLRKRQVLDDLVFCFLLLCDLVRGSDQSRNATVGIPYRESAYRNPAHLAVGPHDSEPLVELPALSGFLKLSKDVWSVLWMDSFLIRRWVFLQALTGATGYRFVGLAYIDGLPGPCIKLPKSLLDVVRHLLELVFGCIERARC